MASHPASNFVYFLRNRQMRISSEGPAANAEPRNRGAMIAESQKPLPGRPAYRNAGTVWMLMAQGIDKYIRGFTHLGGGADLLSAPNTAQPITMLRKRYPFKTTMSQNRTELGVGYRSTLKALAGCPRSAMMKERHMVTEATAKNSPRMVIFPKTL